MKRNENFGKLQAGYLFPEVSLHITGCQSRFQAGQKCISRCVSQIARRRRAHQQRHPDAKVISLGIGDTTEPIPPFIAKAMEKAAAGMGTFEGYSGY